VAAATIHAREFMGVLMVRPSQCAAALSGIGGNPDQVDDTRR
jgi:hypothetical protein